MGKGKEILLGVTASIAIYKACEIIRCLKRQGFAVSVILTKEAEELIRPIVFQSLSGNKVYRGLFDLPESCKIEHLALAEKADLVLVAPATANLIAKLAAGICDDLLTCVICATKAPVLVCPAMNEGMYRNKITQANIERLKRLGYKFIGPSKGRLACGREGLGCLAEVEEIVKQTQRLLVHSA